MSRGKFDDEWAESAWPSQVNSDPDGPSPDAARAMADEMADLVLEWHAAGKGYCRDAVTRIGYLAASADTEVQRLAVTSLFKGLIEPLNDSFDPDSADLADQIMAQLIISHRGRASERVFAETLEVYGLDSECDLLERRTRAANAVVDIDSNRLRKIVVLSRVTVGADVAVTSVIIDHLKAFSPHAEFVLVGPGKLKELFGGDTALRFSQIVYERGGRLAERLNSWTHLSDIVSKETSPLGEGEFLVVDPDSRLTQLGLLPVTRDERSYTLFDSRRFSKSLDESLGEAAGRWAATRFPLATRGQRSFPFVSPMVEAPFDRLAIALKQRTSRPAVFISFGVGGNESKRVSTAFEELLVRALAGEAALIIDKGSSAIEREQVDRIVKVLADEGRSIVRAAEASFNRGARLSGGIVTWEGGIGSFAKLVEACDFYIGYDSAGQHIAAALGRPTLTVFVNGATPRFAERWRPTGRSQARVLSLTPGDVATVPADELASRAMALFQELLMDLASGAS